MDWRCALQSSTILWSVCQNILHPGAPRFLTLETSLWGTIVLYYYTMYSPCGWRMWLMQSGSNEVGSKAQMKSFISLSKHWRWCCRQGWTFEGLWWIYGGHRGQLLDFVRGPEIIRASSFPAVDGTHRMMFCMGPCHQWSVAVVWAFRALWIVLLIYGFGPSPHPSAHPATWPPIGQTSAWPPLFPKLPFLAFVYLAPGRWRHGLP